MMNRERSLTMILEEQQHRDPIVCKDLIRAVHTLLAENMNDAPRVSISGRRPSKSKDVMKHFIDFDRALNARVEWALSKVITGPESQHQELAEDHAISGGYASYPNEYIPALIADVPELRSAWKWGFENCGTDLAIDAEFYPAEQYED